MKKNQLRLIIALSLSFALGDVALGQPPQPPRRGNRPDGAREIEYKGATTFSEDAEVADAEYVSSTGEENAVLVQGKKVRLTSPKIRKSGTPTGRSDAFDFYGTNAAVLAAKEGVLEIEGGSIETEAGYGNALFACGTGVIVAKDVAIKTSEHNSGGIMVTSGGTLTAKNLTVETAGGSSATIRSDRGGGTLAVEGGRYLAQGPGSPAIYSTADITVNDAELTSTCAEGAIVEGRNSITLNRTKLVDDNTTLHGKSTTRKNIFLYQSFSGDAAVGVARFEANDCEIETKRGDTIYVTNTRCEATLRRNKISNADPEGWLLRAQREGWGRKGSNGGNVALTLSEQEVEGNIYVDNISELTLKIVDGSRYVGALNAANTGKRVDLTLDAKSTFELTDDCYVTTLENADATGANIVLNGHTLHVGETERAEDGLPELAGDGDGFGPPPGEGGFEGGPGEPGRPVGMERPDRPGRPGEFGGSGNGGRGGRGGAQGRPSRRPGGEGGERPQRPQRRPR